MFNPIFDITANQFETLVMSLWLGTVILSLIQWGIRYSIDFVQDKKGTLPFPVSIFEDDTFFNQLALLAAFTLLGWVFYGFLIILINWLWFPLTVIAGIIGILHTLRGVVRLKKDLREHKHDKNAHQ